MTRFWQAKSKPKDEEDWKRPLFQRPVIREVNLKPDPSCTMCRGVGWVVENHATVLCYCITRQVAKSERDKVALVLRSP